MYMQWLGKSSIYQKKYFVKNKFQIIFFFFSKLKDNNYNLI